ncbi:MAG: questin oxidase family protein [Anaerolineaceae bacterium]
MTVIDQALIMLSGCGPEFASGLSNHGPMAAEALSALGRDGAVEDWVARYRKRLLDRPRNVARIAPESWIDALGDLQRVSDWEDFFAIELDSMPWADVLQKWVPRLAPGMMSGATHGLIRTAHAVRSIAAAENAERRSEFVAGLAYWAARYQVLPGIPGEAQPVLPSEVIAEVPIMPVRLRSPRPSSIFEAVRELDDFPPFAAVVDLAAPGDDLSAFISDLTATMAVRYLQNSGSASISYVHTVTAPSALRMMAPHLAPETGQLAARYAWQASAAIHSRAHYPHPVELPAALPGPEDLIDRAVFSGDEHAIKFTEACLREYALNPDPAFLAAPLDMCGRYGRKVRDGVA